MERCPRPPCGCPHREGHQGKEDARHLQPHHARKSHNRRHQRALRLPSRRPHGLRVGDASRSSRFLWFRECCHRARRTKRLAGSRIRGTRRVRCLHQRLCGVPSPVSQCPSEFHPIHTISLRGRTLLLSRNDLQPTDIQPLCEGDVKNNEDNVLGGRSSVRCGRWPHDLASSA